MGKDLHVKIWLRDFQHRPQTALEPEVFKTDHILKLEGCKKSTSRPGQSAEAVSGFRPAKKKKREKPGRRHVATKSQRQKGKSITCSSRRGKRGRRPARKPAGEVRAAGAGAGAEARRRRGRRGAVEKGGRSAVGTARHRCGRRPAQPVRSPPLLSGRRTRQHPGPGRGAGGEAGADVTSLSPRPLREGREERRERQQSATVPGRNSQTPRLGCPDKS